MALYALRRAFVVKTCRNLLCAPYCSGKVLRELDYKKCYKILEIPEGSDQEHIRQAYLILVKRHHPDSGDGDVDKFQEVDKAFKTLMDKKARERWDVEDVQVQEQDIRHTAPQHRQYLSYDGIGYGTVFQRQKQYAKVRAMQAAANVLQHRIQKASVDDRALMHKVPVKHKIKTKYGYDRLVEDLIQEAMSKGHFSNLAGSGKPLRDVQSKNPYVDFTTHKINEILIENGFTPEWITLQKEIRQELAVLRDSLYTEREKVGPIPLKAEDKLRWNEILEKHLKLVGNINKKIGKFNLVVPVIQKQMFAVNLQKVAQKVLELGKDNTQVMHKPKEDFAPSVANHDTLFGFLDSIFSRK